MPAFEQAQGARSARLRSRMRYRLWLTRLGPLPRATLSAAAPAATPAAPSTAPHPCPAPHACSAPASHTDSTRSPRATPSPARPQPSAAFSNHPPRVPEWTQHSPSTLFLLSSFFFLPLSRSRFLNHLSAWVGVLRAPVSAARAPTPSVQAPPPAPHHADHRRARGWRSASSLSDPSAGACARAALTGVRSTRARARPPSACRRRR